MEPALTTALNGRVVLAKQTQHGISAKTYANRAGALKAAAKAGGCVFRFPGGRPFYVWIRTHLDANQGEAA